MNANKIIRAIQEAPIVNEYIDENYLSIRLRFKYRDAEYVGVAYCSEEDREFFSPLVGGTIAHMDAMLDMLNDEIIEADVEYKVLKHHYFGKAQSCEPEVFDPTGHFKKAMYRAESKAKSLREARNKLRKELRTYKEDIGVAFESIKKNRANSIKDNEVKNK